MGVSMAILVCDHLEDLGIRLLYKISKYCISDVFNLFNVFNPNVQHFILQTKEIKNGLFTVS